jgi:type 2 lantibiotic biosynthesis protein LanM
MQFSQVDLIKIVEKASNLNERLSGNFIPDPVANNEAMIKERLARWCRVVAGGNKEKFAQRLGRDNMLFNHQVRTAPNQSQGTKDVYSLAYEQMYDSVLDTGFLPRWLFVATGQNMDISGLGGNSGQETLFKVPQWQKVNTDEMTLTYAYQKGRLGKNVPFLEGENLAIKDYVEELVAGFKTMYQFLMEHRDALLDSTSPLSNLARQKVRFTFRATKIYALLLQKSLQLELLKDGAARSIQLDFLSRAEFWSDKINHFNDCNTAGCRQLIQAEKQALEQLDIPIFTAWANSDDLEIDTEEIVEHCFAEPSINLAIARLQRLSTEDLEQQLGFIRGSLYAHIATPADNSDLSTQLTLTAQEAIATEEITREARAIAEKLQEGAISAPNGSLTWIALTYVLQIQRLQLEPLQFSLYDGTCGIALFLAALGKVTGETQWQSLALKALQSLRHNLKDSQASQALANKLGIGGAVGVGSWIYALSKTSQFLDEPDLLADASKAANLITPQQLTETKEYEVVSGVAGAILGLLSLYQIHPQQSILDKAYLAGSHLLQCRTASDSGLRAWQTVNNKLLSGFSHGAAGIVYALLRLYRVTQDASFLEASLEAIAYERTIFDAQLGNWLDLRKEQLQFTNTWCHGATGIGLARLGCLSVLDTPTIQEDLEVALKTAQDMSWQGVDNYCCGNFGRIDLLLEAGTRLQRPELIAAAQKQAAWVVARAQQTGFYQVFNKVPRDTYSPGLFTGISGIGYGLLRLSHPQLLPSVLLWQ